MFKYASIADRIVALQRENAALKAALNKATADLEYTAMMCDVELEIEGADDYEQQI